MMVFISDTLILNSRDLTRTDNLLPQVQTSSEGGWTVNNAFITTISTELLKLPLWQYCEKLCWITSCGEYWFFFISLVHSTGSPTSQHGDMEGWGVEDKMAVWLFLPPFPLPYLLPCVCFCSPSSTTLSFPPHWQHPLSKRADNYANGVPELGSTWPWALTPPPLPLFCQCACLCMREVDRERTLHLKWLP